MGQRILWADRYYDMNMSDKNQTKDAKQQKADRLAQALRDNLRKRKAQVRSRTAADKASISSMDKQTKQPLKDE